MNTILLASNNPDKLREISLKLQDFQISVKSLRDFPGIGEIIEDGMIIEENALKKAKTGFQATGLLTIADDTGLEVEALQGAPGVYSSRFAGPHATYADNRQKLLQVMANIPLKRRKAVFRTVIAICGQDINEVVEGRCEGFITEAERGSNGFGYDAVFLVPEYNLTFAEMPLELKNKISHRAHALDKTIEVIKVHQIRRTEN